MFCTTMSLPAGRCPSPNTQRARARAYAIIGPALLLIHWLEIDLSNQNARRKSQLSPGEYRSNASGEVVLEVRVGLEPNDHASGTEVVETEM